MNLASYRPSSKTHIVNIAGARTSCCVQIDCLRLTSIDGDNRKLKNIRQRE
jgi:hypothetical protein